MAELREGQGLAQHERVTKIRTTTQWLSRVELGRQNLTLATLVKLVNALDVAITDLFVAPREEIEKAGQRAPEAGIGYAHWLGRRT